MPVDTEATPLITEDIVDPNEVTMADVIGEKKEEIKVTVDEQERVQTEDSDEDPLIAYEKAVIEREREKLLKEATERVREEQRAAQLRAQQAQLVKQQQDQWKQAFVDAAKKTKEAFSGLEVYNSENERVEFDDKLVQKFVEPWNDYHMKVQQTQLTNDFQELAEAAFSLMPKDLQEEFAKRAHEKPLPEYLKAFAELLAPHTDYAKAQAGELDIKVKAAEARAAAKLQKVTSPKQIGEHAAVVDKIEITSVLEAAKALAAGQITDEKFRELHAKFKN